MLQSFIGNLRLFFRNKTQVQMMSRFLVAVLCVFAFSLTAYYAMGSLLTGKFNESNRLIVDTVAKSLNDSFKKIDDIYKTMESLNETQNLFRENGVIYAGTDEQLSVITELSNITLFYDFVEEIVFLKKDVPLLLSSRGVMEHESFFERNYNSEQYGAAFFREMLTDYLSVKVIPAASYKDSVTYPTEDPKRLFALVKTVAESDLNIILFLSEEAFLKENNLDSLDNKIRLKIYDRNDSVIFSNTTNNFTINTTQLSANYTRGMIDRNFHKYYITKSNYNYFYYVAEIDNVILKAYLYTFPLLLLGLFWAIYLLYSRTLSFYRILEPVYQELHIDEEDGTLQEIAPKLQEMQSKLRDQFSQIDSISGEIKNSLFMKVVHSSSYYGKNKETADLVFSPILSCQEFVLLSVETILENTRYPRYEIDFVAELLQKNTLSFVSIEEAPRKNLWIIGFSRQEEFSAFLEELKENIPLLKEREIRLLICFSKEFSVLSGLYDAYGDIKMCRDYRGINDKKTFLTPQKILYGNSLFLPVNFKDELAGKMMTKDDGGVKDYIRSIFEVNIKNNIPVIKFEYLLRIMQNTIIELLAVVKRDSTDLFELEQVFMKRVENLREDFDAQSIINSFINLVHLSVSAYDTKKSVLNRGDVIQYINARYHEDLYLERIATKFGTTAKYFSNYFKREFSIGFNEYLTQVRISHAKEILSKATLSIAEVGKKVGYSNPSTFAVAFKKNVGIPPGKYREINQAANKI